MNPTDRLFFAFLAAAGIFVACVRLSAWWKQRRGSPGAVTMSGMIVDEKRHLEDVLRQVATADLGFRVVDGGLRFDHLGLPGRIDFISDQTEIQIRTGNLISQVVEVVPIGFPMALFSGGKERFRARGSRQEYGRIFRRPADEQVLLEVGVAYDLRMSPDGLVLRIHSLPGSAAALRYWMACACRIVDLLPGVEGGASVQVTSVENRVAGDSLCQVCGSSLGEGAIVGCSTCRTPHHAQCWDYTRRCSTFGCPGTRSVA